MNDIRVCKFLFELREREREREREIRIYLKPLHAFINYLTVTKSGQSKTTSFGERGTQEISQTQR